MQIIPVMDLRGGQVVRARRGERDNYRPIVSRLCASSDPFAIADALMRIQPFGTLYLADLDAILGCGDHFPLIRQLRDRMPNTEIWLDAGIQTPSVLERVLRLGVTPVIGSESLVSMEAYRALHEVCPNHVLSLDFNAAGLLGPGVLLEQSTLWPQQVIGMTLARVGSQTGPDTARLGALLQANPQAQIYAAGGVRHSQDLESLAGMGVAGALVASALHDGALGYVAHPAPK